MSRHVHTENLTQNTPSDDESAIQSQGVEHSQECKPLLGSCFLLPISFVHPGVPAYRILGYQVVRRNVIERPKCRCVGFVPVEKCSTVVKHHKGAQAY